MKNVLAVLALVSSSAFAQAPEVSNTGTRADLQTLPVLRNQLGTGSPAPMITVGTETAVYVDDGYYHIPQYLPMYPTAGVIWPRVVDVDCEMINGKIVCEGYHWSPARGRAEYIMIMPRMKAAPPTPAPAQCCTAPRSAPIIVYREVPVKKKPE